MARGVRASSKQKAASRKNVVKAQVSRVGLRGQRYQPRRPR